MPDLSANARKNILIIDDSSSHRKVLRTILEGAGFSVIEAEDGKAGLKLAMERDDIDMFISDLNMPGLDGLSMLQKIRSISRHQKTPAFMMTTEYNELLKQKASFYGVLAWIVKPVKPDKLINVIKGVLK